jgi:prolipoprotein diacylglyceryltransferase
MATRYSKRQHDGTVEYYDSRAELEAANPPVSMGNVVKGFAGAFNPLFAVIGFLVGGIVALWWVAQMDTWPTWIRFGSVVAAATVVGYLAGKIGNALFMLAVALTGASIVGGIGYLIWRAL